METNRILYLGIVLLLLAFDCSLLDWKVKVIAKTEVDPQSIDVVSSNEQRVESGSVSGSKGTEKEQKNKVSKSKEDGVGDVGKNSNSNSNDLSDQSGSVKTDEIEKVSSDLNGKVKVQADGVDSKKGSLNEKPDVHDKKTKLNGQSQVEKVDKKGSNVNEKSKVGVDDKKQKTISKESNNEGDPEVDSKGSHVEVESKGSHVEECDPSNKCIDEENKLVACLRVPGNDPQYSLLIQNKGKKTLEVAISAPEFVELEKTVIQLQAKEDKKVKVSLTNGGRENLIVLRAGNGRCNLDIKHLIADNFGKEIESSHKSTYLNFISRTPSIVVLACAALLLLAAGWTCISFRRKQLFSTGYKYQRLDMDLPVSDTGKVQSEINNSGWDNNWGDGWDDEGAPKTPTLPVTPNLSSKGLASRRLSKEGWKD